jgi:hypothetical protein
VPRPDENSNGGLYPATRSPVSRSLDFITQAPLGGCCAEATQPRPEDTPELASEGTPAEDMAPEEQAKHHVRHVRRLLNKFDRQVRFLNGFNSNRAVDAGVVSVKQCDF